MQVNFSKWLTVAQSCSTENCVFLQLFESVKDTIYGAYGNSNTDVEAYLKVGIRSSLIFLVDESGKLRQVANGSLVTSYGQQAQRVNEMYP